MITDLILLIKYCNITLNVKQLNMLQMQQNEHHTLICMTSVMWTETVQSP